MRYEVLLNLNSPPHANILSVTRCCWQRCRPRHFAGSLSAAIH